MVTAREKCRYWDSEWVTAVGGWDSGPAVDTLRDWGTELNSTLGQGTRLVFHPLLYVICSGLLLRC